MNGIIRPFIATAGSTVTFDVTALGVKNYSAAVYYFNLTHTTSVTKLFSVQGTGDLTLTGTIPTTLPDSHTLVLPVGKNSTNFGASGLYVLIADGTAIAAKAHLILLGSPKDWEDGYFLLGNLKLTGGDFRGTGGGGLLHQIPDAVFGSPGLKMGTGMGTLSPRLAMFCTTRDGVLPSPALTGPVVVQRGSRMVSTFGRWQTIGGEPIGVFDVSTLADETDSIIQVSASNEDTGPGSSILQKAWDISVTDMTGSDVSVFFAASAPPTPAIDIELEVSGDALAGTIVV